MCKSEPMKTKRTCPSGGVEWFQAHCCVDSHCAICSRPTAPCVCQEQTSCVEPLERISTINTRTNNRVTRMAAPVVCTLETYPQVYRTQIWLHKQICSAISQTSSSSLKLHLPFCFFNKAFKNNFSWLNFQDWNAKYPIVRKAKLILPNAGQQHLV